MKYIMIEIQGPGGISRLEPVIFSDRLVHQDVAEGVISKLPLEWKAKPVSAGEILLDVESTHGKSLTLELEANPGDAQVINAHDYLHGIKFK